MAEVWDFISDGRVVDALQSAETRLVMVIGGPDTGKTTLVESVAGLLSASAPVAVADLDMGQSHIAPLTTVAWGIVSGGFRGWHRIEAEEFYFTGTLSPLGSLLPTVVGSMIMVERAGKVIVDTTGLVSEPAGRLLKHFKIEALSPDMIIAIGVVEGQ